MVTRSYLNIVQDFTGKGHVIPFAFPRRNLKEEAGFEGVIAGKHYSNGEKVINTLCRKDPLIGAAVETELINCIRDQGIDIVFLFRSIQAHLLKVIKKEFPALPVVAFYHDIYPEVFRTKRNLDKKDFILKYIVYKTYLKSEKYCSRHADANIVLNNRERRNFIKYYGKEPDLVSPIVCKDCFDSSKIQEAQNDAPLKLCFIGSYFGPNIHGIKWFISSVMPQLSDRVELEIVGNKMEKLTEEIPDLTPNIKIVGSVESLEPYYYGADVVIAPIFQGTGMKTKTAEALMYGKVFLGTEEALCGYDGMGPYLCSTAEDFVKKIRFYEQNRPPKFVPEMRQMYENKYSTAAVSESLKTLFDYIIGDKKR